MSKISEFDADLKATVPVWKHQEKQHRDQALALTIKGPQVSYSPDHPDGFVHPNDKLRHDDMLANHEREADRAKVLHETAEKEGLYAFDAADRDHHQAHRDLINTAIEVNRLTHVRSGPDLDFPTRPVE